MVLTNVTKNSILDVMGEADLPPNLLREAFQKLFISKKEKRNYLLVKHIG